jgi:hypothetical protein
MIDTLKTARNLEAAGFDRAVAEAIARENLKANTLDLMGFNPIETAEVLEAAGLPHPQAMAIADVMLTAVKVREAQRVATPPRRASKWPFRCQH